MKTIEQRALNFIRDHLQRGATIKATDVEKPVLTIMPDGSCHGNLSILYPDHVNVTAENAYEACKRVYKVD